MRIRPRTWITLLAALAGLAAAEVGVRHIDRRRPPPAQGDPLPIRECADPRIRFENRPGASQALRYFDRDGREQREVVAHINDLGYRGRPVETRKPAGTLRIVVVGDSQTFGTGVADADAWPAALEAGLAPRLSGPSLEVLNCAVPGYDAEQEAASLEARWIGFEPDLVLVGYFVNDAAFKETGNQPGLGPLGWLMPLAVPNGHGFTAWLRERSALVDFVLDGAYRRLRVREWALGAAALYAEGAPGWTRARAALRSERDVCRAHGARLGVVLLPFFVRWDGGLVTSRPYRAVAAFCAAEGISFLDLEPAFAGLDLEEMLVNDRDPHSGAAAHRIEAAAVVRWVLEAGLLRSGPR